MTNNFQVLLLLFGSLVLGGCSVKEYAKSEPKIITFKTKQLRFSDLGYIRQDGDALQLELFSAGQVVERFEINHLVCISDGCMTKGSFNEAYLHPAYPDDILQDLLLGKAIMEGAGLTETETGFEQHLVTGDYAITYRVSADEIYFRDKTNALLVRIRNVRGAR